MSCYRFKLLNNSDLTILVNFQNEMAKVSPKFTAITIEEFKLRIECEGIDLGLSIGAFQDKRIVGFILHSKQNEHLFSSSIVIDLEEKETVLFSKMYLYALPLFKSFNIELISTVIPINQDLLIRTLRKLDFKKWRTLESVKGTTHYTNTSVPDKLIIEPAKYSEYLVLFTEKNIIPTFDNSDFVISNSTKTVIIKKAMIDNATVGYIAFDNYYKKILQLYVKENYRRKKIASELVKSVIAEGENLTMLHIDSQHFGLLNFLKKLGGKQSYESVELRLDLK